MNQIQAYTELLIVVQKYPEEFKDDWEITRLGETLERLKMQEKFGLRLEGGGTSYNVVGAFNNFTRVSLYGEEYNRTIGWSDDDRQPENEWLFCICFPTGPYIFGDYFKDEYPTETFSSFFNELKGFEPKYIDSANKALYYTESSSKAVYEAFGSILKKYQGLVKDELLRKRKKELELELAKLNESAV